MGLCTEIGSGTKFCMKYFWHINCSEYFDNTYFQFVSDNLKNYKYISLLVEKIIGTEIYH